ncbi:hypothetical protein D3C76_977540 [compost metagenome]
MGCLRGNERGLWCHRRAPVHSVLLLLPKHNERAVQRHGVGDGITFTAKGEHFNRIIVRNGQGRLVVKVEVVTSAGHEHSGASYQHKAILEVRHVRDLLVEEHWDWLGRGVTRYACRELSLVGVTRDNLQLRHRGSEVQVVPDDLAHQRNERWSLGYTRRLGPHHLGG